MLATWLGPSLPALAAERISVPLEDLPPYSSPDAQGQPQGYAVELARELLRRAGLEGDYAFESWPRVMRAGQSRPNVLLPAIVRLPQREHQFHWLGTTTLRQGTLYRLKSRPEVAPRDIEGLKAYRIAVVKDDVAEQELLDLGLKLGVQIDRSADVASVLRKFLAGRDDLVAINPQFVARLFQQHGLDAELIEPVLSYPASARPSIAVSLATAPALRQQLQQAWDSMRRDGTVAALARRHGVPAPD
ncbi:transporter substrate-binding domain-containing protein [Paucibacter sp. APW11]|uniref:Transporter substrate-binding domain-containing protein n=1 Tax=Roseateles aquae TaxID=3077235 RepID=A0ABU3PDC0_9BURK|nr:transporter substrate-binding domain-containing protein [Paucibacter sp. APW11]MDT9000133.1 transporter substrate-binding domain-containing protein [Paucibacter sp. APW11]